MKFLADVLQRFWSRPELRPPPLSQPTELLNNRGTGVEWRRLAALVEAAEDGLLACDAEGALSLINPAAANLLGVQPLWCDGASEWPEELTWLRRTAQRALEEGNATLELEVERNGKKLLLRGCVLRITSESGHVDGAALVLRDATRMNELAASVERSWPDLAHDLKTPINSMLDFTALLLEEAVGPLNALQRGFPRTIEQEGERALQAVQSSLQDARAVGVNSRLNVALLDLRPLVDEVVQRLRPLALQKSLVVEIAVPESLPGMEADPEKVRLVLTNLLDNAISFSGEGARIEVAARQDGVYLEVSGQDEGIGIPSQSLDEVFGAFYRAPNQPGFSRPGAGLGLAICKRVVEQHGGRIWAVSGQQGGARLAFTLPVAQLQDRPAPIGALT